MTTTKTEGKMSKAIKVARLAWGESRLGNEDAAATAGATAGRLAYEAGETCHALSELVPGLCGETPAWNAIVDGWYDARDAARLPEERAREIVAHLASTGRADMAADLERLMAEALAARAA